jgi:glucokinase-like ROK family protein
MKRLNRSAVLELLREQGPLSRARIARILHLSPATVTRIVNELMEENLVLDMGTDDSTGGRRPTLLEFNYAANAIIGIDMGGTNIVGALADLGGNILQEASLPSSSGDGRKDGLEQLIEVIEQLLRNPRLEDQELRGIGIGVPSITLHQEGVVVWAASLGWRNLPLKKILEDRFQVPVFAENDVNLAALGESWYGTGKGTGNLVCISIGTGIGAGIVIGGKLYRGHSESAGEVGYLVPDSSYLGNQYEHFGCIETLSAGPGIVRRALAMMERNGDTLLRELTGGDSKTLTAEKVFEAARRGDPLAQEVVDETVDYLSLIVASVAAILNPELIVLGGGVARSADLLVEPIRRRVEGVVPVMPVIKASELGESAAVMGAIAMVLHSTDDALAMG